jgi:hypothetical protein
MARRMREVPWAVTPFGPPDRWPAALRTAVALMLRSKLPMYVAWGPRWRPLHNDAYAPLLGARHPDALGAEFPAVWPEVWPALRAAFQEVLTGSVVHREDQLMVLRRRGRPEEGHFTYSLGAIGGDDGRDIGVFCACTETTGRVVGERRLRALAELGKLATSSDAEAACTAAVEVLAAHRADVPAALIYLLDDGRTTARLAAHQGVAAGGALAPATVRLDTEDRWAATFADVHGSGRSAVVGGLADYRPRDGDRTGRPPVDVPDDAGPPSDTGPPSRSRWAGPPPACWSRRPAPTRRSTATTAPSRTWSATTSRRRSRARRPSRRSAAAWTGSPSSTGPRPRSSPASATSSAPRSR